jgi:flagellar hook-associated protein 1 FlgK
VSITSILSVARTGLTAHQAAIETISHNIANAETEGYSRQRVTLSANLPQRLPYGNIGTGVGVANVERVRDTLLDGTYRREAGGAAFHGTSRDLLTPIEGVFGEPSTSGLAASMDAFWSAWSDLANDPTSSAARSVVQQRGAAVATRLNGFDQQLADAQQQNDIRLRASVDELNALAAEVAKLNASIVSSEVSGKDAGDLRDLRDLRIDRIAKLGDARVFERWDGSVQVLLGNTPIVDGTEAKTLELTVTTPPRLRYAGTVEPFQGESIGGAIGALTSVVGRTIPELRGRLDALAQSLVDRVNGVHETGYVFASGSPTGVPAGAFFHPGDPGGGAPPTLLPVTARSIRLSDAVRADAGQIAASGNANGAANDAIAKALAGFRTASTTVSYTPPGGGAAVTASFSEFYRQTVTTLGAKVQEATSAAASHETLASQAETRRQAVSGVSTDEELVLLMRHQQAYAAASKLVNLADEMMRTLLEMV